MKPTLLLPVLLAFSTSVFSQANQWTWVSGDNASNQPGIYGIKGVASAAGKPGARDGASSWTDASGNLWLFGGFGNTGNGTGYLNDLWKYTVGTGQWTWMSGSNVPAQKGLYGTRGVASANSTPGARLEAYAFTDASGDFWLFGGAGYTASGQGFLNDLWRYSPSTSQWAWISGDTIQDQRSIYGIQGVPAAANKPGARYWGAAGGVDAAGNLWLYGGTGQDASSPGSGINFLGDLWKYSISSGQWTWVGGTNIGGVAPVYGSKGTAAATNRPGGRAQSVGWTDASGNFWLFGGVNVSPFLNDLWKYDVSTGSWTWVTGSNIANQGGAYGIKGVANPANTPGARVDATTKRDAAGNLLLFGGSGRVPSNQLNGPLNDLWSFSPTAGQWTWINGDTTQIAFGQYGTKGTPAPTNKPGPRSRLVSFLDPAGDFWIFGGSGIALINVVTPLNDLWRYTFSASTAPGGINGFTAQKESRAVTLSWTSRPDQNIRSFVVERYNRTVTGYQNIGTVPATASSSRYSFSDNTPLPGTNFYRIRLVDQSGSMAYSSTAQVDLSQYATQFSVYQNPVQNILQLVVQLPARQKVTLQIRDMSGHVLIQQEQTGYPGRSSFSVPVERLSKGTYLIQVQSESINNTKTFIKQ